MKSYARTLTVATLYLFSAHADHPARKRTQSNRKSSDSIVLSDETYDPFLGIGERRLECTPDTTCIEKETSMSGVYICRKTGKSGKNQKWRNQCISPDNPRAGNCGCCDSLGGSITCPKACSDVSENPMQCDLEEDDGTITPLGGYYVCATAGKSGKSAKSKCVSEEESLDFQLQNRGTCGCCGGTCPASILAAGRVRIRQHVVLDGPQALSWIEDGNEELAGKIEGSEEGEESGESTESKDENEAEVGRA